ncbi:MAG: type II CAAX endopeptidase family protein [Cyclobacteriaceae bacterium]
MTLLHNYLKNHLISAFLLVLVSCLLIIPQLAIGQQTADKYLSDLKNSKDSLYNQIIRELDDYILRYPDSANIRIVRCTVIENAYYDSYEDYNPNYELAEICLDELIRDFPLDLDVLLYKLDHIYGDSAIALGERIIEQNTLNQIDWEDEYLAIVYKKLGESYHYYQDEPQKALSFYKLAQNLNDTLNLNYTIAQRYIELNQPEMAKRSYLSWTDSTLSLGELRQKADGLLDVGATEQALEIYKKLMQDSAVWLNYEKIAKAFSSTGEYVKAREFLLRELDKSYYQSESLHQLLDFDFRHSPADTIMATYEKLMDEGWANDAFGKYRMKLLTVKPFSGWRFTDLWKMLIFSLILIVLFILPYTWILPLYYLSHRYFKNRKIILPETTWGLKDFWLISSAILLIQFLYAYLFSYDELLSYLDISTGMQEISNVNESAAYGTLFYFVSVAFVVLFFVLRKKQWLLSTTVWPLSKCIGKGIGAALLMRFVYVLLVRVGLFPKLDFLGEASVVDSVKSINDFIHPLVGFVMVVIVVPLYEEYIFRGIALSAMEKRVGFAYANVIQAIMFALLHDNLTIFFFYVAFGLITGRLVRQSKSLLPGMVFHATNNLIAWLIIL